jgi:hypothetical protein
MIQGHMKVGDSVRHGIDEWQRGNFEASMLHACNAVDGTASKQFPGVTNNRRFTRLLRENYGVLGPMGIPGINIMETRFPVAVPRPTTPDGKPDLADVIYGIHRCTHGHGDELPNGFDLIPNAGSSTDYTRMELNKQGHFRMSDRIIFGLLAVAVFAPVNVGQSAPGYWLTWGTQTMIIDEWWGRAGDFLALVAAGPPMPHIKMDFGEWMP